MTGVAAKAIGWTESGLVPDTVIRSGMRRLLERIDARRADIMPILAETYGEKESGRWWMRWRMILMACEELFRYNGGKEWFVSHYRFKKADN